jgi:hypothetical protein
MKNQILEALGVPDNLIPSARKFYELLLDQIKLELDKDEETFEFSIVPPEPLPVGEYSIHEVSVKITITETNKVQEPRYYSMGVGSNLERSPKFIDKSKITTDIKNPEFTMEFAVPLGWELDQLFEYFVREKPEIVSSISHEFKHLYDDQKNKWELFKDRSRYISGRDVIRFDIPPLDRFGYLIYFTHMIESLVRPTEMLALLEENKISKRKFINFLSNTRVYKLLKEANDFKVDDLRSNIQKNYMDRVNEILDMLMIQGRKKMSDEEKVNKVLEIFYINLVNKDLESFKNLLGKNFMGFIFGFDEHKEKVYKKHANYLRRFEKNPIDYFRFEEKYMKMLTDNIIRKIHKLYALLPEDNFNSNMNLHKKISSRK